MNDISKYDSWDPEGGDIKFNRTTSIKIAGDKVTVTDTANELK